MRLPWMMSDLHPHALSLDEAAFDRPDFARDLTADLAAMNPPDVIHRYRCVSPEGAQATALQTAGFHATRLTRLFDLPVSLTDHPTLCAPLPDHIAPHWFVLGERAPWADWVDAHWRAYQSNHQSNPAIEPPCGLNAVFIGDDLIEGLALRNGPQGRIRAFSSLRDGGEIGWVGGPPDLLPQTLAATLRRASAVGWTTATLEVDDDNAALWSLIDKLGQPAAQTFVTWHRERDPAHAPN